MITRMIALCVICLVACVPAVVPRTNVTTRAEAVARHLTGRQLDPIEGVWSTPDNFYEIVIVRNSGLGAPPEYDYVGIITEAGQGATLRPGDIRFMLKRTAEPGTYTGNFFAGPVPPSGASVAMRTRNSIQISAPRGIRPENLQLIRLFPGAGDLPAGAIAARRGNVEYPEYGRRPGSDLIEIPRVAPATGRPRLDRRNLSSPVRRSPAEN